MHRIFIRHIAQNFLTYVSMPAKFMCNLPNKSTAHLNDIGFSEVPLIRLRIAFCVVFRIKEVIIRAKNKTCHKAREPLLLHSQKQATPRSRRLGEYVVYLIFTPSQTSVSTPQTPKAVRPFCDSTARPCRALRSRSSLRPSA